MCVCTHTHWFMSKALLSCTALMCSDGKINTKAVFEQAD